MNLHYHVFLMTVNMYKYISVAVYVSLHCRICEMFCLFVVFPLWVVLPLLFISNKASVVAKVGLRLPGSHEHLGAPEPGALWRAGNSPESSFSHQHPAGRDANRDVKEGEPSALNLDLFLFAFRILSTFKISICFYLLGYLYVKWSTNWYFF